MYQYDYLTNVFTAIAIVQPCQTYHIKLAVADAVDGALDSGIFLKKNSFSAANLEIHTNYAQGQSTIEGCSGATLSFKLAEISTQNDTIHYTISGTATNGVDFPVIPSNYIVIPAGQDSSYISIQPFDDGLPEGIEFIRFVINVPSCSGMNQLVDTIYIRDNTPLNPFISQDTTACENTVITLHSLGRGSQSPYNYHWSTGEMTPNITLTTLTGIQWYKVIIQDACGYSWTDSVMVTGKPLPVITTLPTIYSICSGETTNVPLLSNPAGSTYSWTANCINPLVSGYANGSGGMISQTLQNLSNDWDTVKYLVTAVNNGCPGPPIPIKVGVAPKPTVHAAPAIHTICSGDNCNILLSSLIAGVTFTWTYRYSSSFLSGASAGSGMTIVQALVNSGVSNDTVIYKVVPHLGSCLGDTVFAKVVVLPPPLPVIGGPASVCNGIASTFSTQAGMSGYTWTVTPDGTITSGAGTNSIVVQWLTNGPKTVKVTFSNALGCSPPQPSMYNVTVNALPVISVAGPASVCQFSTGNIYTAPGGMTGYTWSVSAGGTITSGGGTGDQNATITWNAAGAQNVSLNYTNSSGCTATAPLSYPVTVHSLPVPTVTGSLSVCSGVTGEVYSTENSKSNYVWQVTGGTVTAGGSATDNTVTVSWLTAGTGTVSVNYTDGNSCTALSATSINVLVKPLPDVIFSPPLPSVCGGQTTNIGLSSSLANPTFTWTASTASPTVTGYGPGSGNLIAQTLTTSGFFLETVTYHVTPVASLCAGPIADVTVQVNPKPHVTNSPMNQTICSEGTTNIHLTSSCPGTIFTWTPTVATGNITGFSAGTGSDVIQTLTNLLPTTGEVQYTISFNAGTCIGNDTIFSVFVKPKPHVLTFNPDTAICNGMTTAVHLNSDVAGSTFTWTASGSSANIAGFSNGSGNVISQNIVNSGFTDETVTYSITGHANGCDGFLKTYVVTVHPVADVYFSPVAETICSGTQTNISVLSHVAGSSYSWTATPGSANVNGFSNSSGSTIAQTLNNTGTTPEIVTYQVIPVANGCTGTPSAVVATVNPIAHVTNAPLQQTNCSGSLFTFNLASDVTGTSYTWTALGTSAAITGYADGVGGIISQTLSNSGFDIDSVIYTITPTANACTGIAKSYYAIINPVPDISNNPMSGQICSGNNTNIALTSNVLGTNFSWTCTPSSGNITGFSPGSGTTISNILVNLGLVQESVTYHVTPTANGCLGQTRDYLESISEVPDVYFTPALQTICSATPTNISILSHVTGATFTWTASGSSANVSGYADGAGNTIAQTLVNSGNNFETVTYTATPSAFGCPPGIAQQVVVTVNPVPHVNNGVTTFAICSATATNIALTSTQPGSTYTWTASGSSANVSGFSASAGPLIAQTLSNNGFVNETVTYTVIPRANNCDGDAFNFTITVYPVADVLFTPATQAFCTGSTTNVSIASNVAGTTYTWTCIPSSANVSGYSDGSGNLIQQTLLNSGNAIENVRYRTTPVANGCTGTFSEAVVTVHPNPVVSFASCFDMITTDNAKPIVLKGVSPAGGTFGGTGVSGNVFDPAIAGAGTHTISYAYSNTWGCNGSTTQNIIVMPAAPFNCGGLLTDLRDNKTYPTVQIGTQCWMAANLDYGTMIPMGQMQRDNCVREKYCYWDTPTSCDTRGGVYQWDEVMGYIGTSEGQGMCPPAWHVPSENDWNNLFANYGGKGFTGSPLKTGGFSGFDANVFGNYFDNREWHYKDFGSFFWSSTIHGTHKAWGHGLNNPDPSISTYPANKSHAFSVRCVKD